MAVASKIIVLRCDAVVIDSSLEGMGMTEKFSIYVSGFSASCTVKVDGVQRETSAPTINEMVSAMPEADKVVLLAFARIVLGESKDNTLLGGR